MLDREGILTNKIYEARVSSIFVLKYRANFLGQPTCNEEKKKSLLSGEDSR